MQDLDQLGGWRTLRGRKGDLEDREGVQQLPPEHRPILPEGEQGAGIGSQLPASPTHRSFPFTSVEEELWRGNI